MSENQSQMSQEISQKTVTWLAQLPRGVQPTALVQHFPRITNRIAELWELPVPCEKYLNELLFDTRDGTRAGFAPEIAFEISYLKALMTDIIERRRQALNPGYVNIWEQQIVD